MPLITSADLLQDFVGPMLNTGDLGRPEVPDNWGSEQGGYINDWPDSSWGGMTNGHGIYRVLPWWLFVCEASYNPVGANFRVQLLAMRHHVRKTTKAWSQLSAITDPRGGAMDYRISNGPVGEVNLTIASSRIVTPASGGVAFEMINDYCIHGYPLSMYSPNYSADDCLVVTMLARLIPKDPAQEFNWADYRVSLYLGQDNYGGGWVAEHSHGRFKRLTDKWQVYGCGSVQRPNWSNQGPGLSTTEYSNYPSPLPPEERVWLERGAYSSSTDKQILVLKRSAAVTAAKTYTLSVTRGTASAVPATVVMAAGSASVQFEVTTPDTLPTSQQIMYATDGGSEDHWFAYTFGTGSSTGDAGGSSSGGTTANAAATFSGIDSGALVTTALQSPSGSQRLKYSSDVVSALGTNPIFEIRIGTTVVYRSTVTGALTASSAGVTLPSQFVEPPSINVANALTAADAVIALKNATQPVEITVPVKAGAVTAGFLTASVALNGSQAVRTNAVILTPPTALD